MQENPLISVIILCYNQADTIKRTLDSVMAQNTEYTFEVIIGEDASPNGQTRAICEEYRLNYPHIVKLMPKTANKGVIKNYSDCIDEAKGKYIAACAGDDWWHNPNKLQMEVEYLESNEDYGLVYTDFDTVDIDTFTHKRDCFAANGIVQPSGYIYHKLMEGNVILACTAVYRSDIFRKHVDFNEFISLGFLMEDYPTWLEMSQHTKFRYIPVSTTTYSIQNGSLSNNLNNLEKFESFEKSVFEIKKHYNAKYPTYSFDEATLLELLYVNLIYKCLRGKHFERASYYAKQLHNKTLKNFFLKTVSYFPLNRFYSNYLNK